MNSYGRARYTAGSSSALSEARTLVMRLLADLRDHPIGHDILDASELPASRDDMIEAFRLLIELEPRSRIRDQLKLVGALLSQFQHGVGPRLKVRAAPPPSEEPEQTPPDVAAVRRMERALAAVEPDRLRLTLLFEQAAERAKAVFKDSSSTDAWRYQAQSASRDAWMAR